jgi:hypothetical protein
VLLDDHYHLVIETPKANLVADMQWLQTTFTRRFNVRHRKWSRVFGHRCKVALVEGGAVRVGWVRARAKQGVLDNPSCRVAGGDAMRSGKRPRWLAASQGLAASDRSDTAAGLQNGAAR